MGFGPFKGKTLVAVQVATTAIHEEIPEDRLTNAVLSSINQNTDLSNILLLNNLTGYKSMLNNYYSYGKNNYTYGLPESNLANDRYNIEKVLPVLTSIAGEAITISESFLYRPTIEVWGRWWLQENESNYDYNSHTLTIGAIVWNVVGFTENAAKTEITALLENGINVSTYGPILDYPANEIYYTVIYQTVAAPAVDITWLYQPSLNTYPTLVVTNTFDTSTLFPVVPIRIDDSNVNSDKTSDVYKTTKQLLSKTKVDLDSFTESLTKQQTDSGELTDIDDLDKISDIFLLYGLNIYGTSPVEKLAIYETFKDFISTSRVSKTIYDTAVAAGKLAPRNVVFVESATFDYEIVFNYITSTTNLGKIGSFGEVVISFAGADLDSTPIEALVNANISYMTIQYQHTPSEYVELIVHGLYSKHTVKTVKKDKNFLVFLENYTEGDDLTDNQSNFIVPLTKPYLDTLTALEGDLLIPLTANVTVYASDSQYVKWYKTKAFASILNFVLTAVGIILAIPSGGTSIEVVTAIATFLVIKFTFEYILRSLLIRFEDNDAARALILVAAVFVSTTLTTDFSELTTAEIFLKSVNSVTQVTNIYTSTEFELLEEDRLTFLQNSEEAEKELEAAAEFLKVDTAINPSALIDTRNYVYETPETFFSRTLNTAPGLLVFDQMHNYVDNNLNLEYI